MKENVQLKWLTALPSENKKYALLIPQFNEASSFNFDVRLTYYQNLARLYKYIDIILIDDGSTDNSLDEINNFLDNKHYDFLVASVTPNAQKIGALYLVAKELSHEYIILSDFDTNINGLENLENVVHSIEDERIMGGYFRMLPSDGSGNVFLFQQLEYSLARSLYKMHETERTVPVMPGAGSIYKREILMEIYADHSGLRNGEDREATLLGQKLGYKAIYIKDICALTKPPQTMNLLIKQRIRWNLGYIETFVKEKKYYISELKQRSAIGRRFIFDVLSLSFSAILPFLIFLLCYMNWILGVGLIGVSYATGIVYSLILLQLSPFESFEFKDRKLVSVLYYPIYQFALDYTAWPQALHKFIQQKRKMK